MNSEEYKKKKEELKRQLDLDLGKIQQEYAFANSTVEIGDVLEIMHTPTKMELVKVLKVKYTRQHMDSGTLPYCVYYCETLKKDGTSRKNPEYVNYHQASTLFKVRKPS